MMRRPVFHLIAVAALLALLGVAYGFWYVAVERKSAESAALAADIDRAIADAERAAATRSALASLAVDERTLENYFLSVDGIVPFLEGLEATGRGTGALVEVVSVSDTPTSDNRVALSLRISGPFDAVVRTIGRIEYGAYDSRIENLTLDTGFGAAGEWTAAAVFSIGLASPQ
ncbi:MAG TPA: hypothetical protein VHO23_00520 [Candidatus Paceibacterota bacterium]|nr:hypothetical protein [Candidatus Paceibacterota bacterium]